jgi:CubicO group peptidase (beta-lactamase class C family)
MKPGDVKSVSELMEGAVAEGVFPGGVLLVSRENRVFFHKAFGYTDLYRKRPVTLQTFFDLASLTKPLATTLAVMKLVATLRLKLSDPLGRLIPELKTSPSAAVTVEHLLAHRSGLPDYRPFYQYLQHLPPHERKDALNRLLSDTALIYPIGGETLYSDLGFMMLRWVIERTANTRLDHFVQKEIYRPLGLENLFFAASDMPARTQTFAATEVCAWRNALVEGSVHDENAFAVGGVEGHAGLFGTAHAVHALLCEIQALYHGATAGDVLKKEIVREFLNYGKETGRALGFDRPSGQNSSSGRYFSKNSVGHLGFTGVSFWMDLDRSIIIVLLTNRIHPTRKNEKIKIFRPLLHDAVMARIEHAVCGK